MLERVVENWLDNTTERLFQQPYCYMLSADGHTIIHSTRHSAMELGKDVITINQKGIPCAFQLKTGNITLHQWRENVAAQTSDLVTLQISHPSVGNSIHHKSYLVTNGRIEEEVSHAIEARNRSWKRQGLSYCLKTVVRGELLKKAKRLGVDLWPSELTDIKTLLEMFLEDGRNVLPKEKLASLFESTVPLELPDNGKKPSKNHCVRAIASSGFLCAIAISSFSNENNHVAEIEAWVLYIGYVFAVAEKWDIPSKIYKNEFEIATQSIYNSLENLCNEIRERDNLIEAPSLEDSYVYEVRLTWLLGLMGIYALWRRSKGEPKAEIDDFISEFCKEKRKHLYLWGEAAIPQFLAYFWYFRKIDATPKPDFLIHNLISLICEQNHPRSETFLASPYYEVETILPHIFSPILGPAVEPIEETLTGKSYVLEGLVHLSVRRNWKQTMKSLWPGVTRLTQASFEPDNFSDFYRWTNKDRNGITRFVIPKRTQDWEELKTLANESEGTCIPPTIKEHPILLLLFLCVYPHRMNAEIIRWLDTQMQQIPRP